MTNFARHPAIKANGLTLSIRARDRCATAPTASFAPDRTGREAKARNRWWAVPPRHRAKVRSRPEKLVRVIEHDPGTFPSNPSRILVSDGTSTARLMSSGRRCVIGATRARRRRPSVRPPARSPRAFPFRRVQIRRSRRSTNHKRIGSPNRSSADRRSRLELGVEMLEPRLHSHQFQRRDLRFVQSSSRTTRRSRAISR